MDGAYTHIPWRNEKFDQYDIRPGTLKGSGNLEGPVVYKEVKLSLCLINKHLALKMYEEVEV
jgi:hypothetical protein